MIDRASVQERVRQYWDGNPCDSGLSELDRGSREYFLEIERRRYELQPHILDVISRMDWRGKSVLEIGAGVGSDARQIIARGAVYAGINIDRASTETASRALRIFSLPGVVLQCDATRLVFPENAFDAVYAFGVLHHIPDATMAVAEIRRVLKPGGDLLLMLYNRASINYVVEIMFLRKLGLRLLSIPGAPALLQRAGFPRAKLERHKELFGSQGQPTEQEWLSRNTNGPDNPFARVYSAAEAEDLLEAFRIESNQVYFFDHRHWGVFGRLFPARLRRALGRRWGWHRVLHARKI